MVRGPGRRPVHPLGAGGPDRIHGRCPDARARPLGTRRLLPVAGTSVPSPLRPCANLGGEPDRLLDERQLVQDRPSANLAERHVLPNPVRLLRRTGCRHRPRVGHQPAGKVRPSPDIRPDQ